MSRQINLTRAAKPVQEFIRGLGRIREPIELVLDGNLVAKVIPPSELSAREKKRILDEGWREESACALLTGGP